MDSRTQNVGPANDRLNAHYEVYDEGTLAVLDNACLPDQCVDCGETFKGDLEKNIKKFSYVRPVVFLWVLLGPLVLLLAYFICRKRFRLHLCRCRACLSRQSQALRFFFVSCTVMLGFMFLNYYYQSNIITQAMLVISALSVFASVWIFATQSSQLTVKGFTNGFFLIKGLNKRFMANVMEP